MGRILSALLIAFGLSLLTPPSHGAFRYGTDTVRGVNLGSWLVLEKWITPSVFAGLPGDVDDEYKLCKHLGYAEAKKRLKKHWDTWFTEEDVKALKEAGINHIRIPIGYWALDIKEGEPWVKGSWDYVVKAAGWARTHGLQVMVDLHGAPGSQNGNHHSGRAGPIEFYNNDENLNRATNVLGQIAKYFNAPEWRTTVSIIQLLNEPVIWADYNGRLAKLKQFYRQAYDEIRKHNDIIVIAVHDAFIDPSNWYYLRDDPHYYWIMLDRHLYEVFGDQWSKMSCTDLANYPCSYLNTIPESNAKLWTVVGEWSLAMPNGCPNKADFAKQQIGIYERGSGWFMWTAKHETSPEWSFLGSVKNGWIDLKQNYKPTC